MIAIIITGCRECPFVIADEQPWYCDAEQADPARCIGHVNPPDPEPPAWCPLRTADRLVTLRVK